MSESQYRLAHTMIRVRDLEKSLDFYTRILGMQVLRQKEYPGGRFTNTFVGYGPEETHPAIELTYNWDQEEPYDMGNGWGHVALEVPDFRMAEAPAPSMALTAPMVFHRGRAAEA